MLFENDLKKVKTSPPPKENKRKTTKMKLKLEALEKGRSQTLIEVEPPSSASLRSTVTSVERKSNLKIDDKKRKSQKFKMM